MLPGLIRWIIERPRIEDDLRRTIRVGQPLDLSDAGLVVRHADVGRLLGRIDYLKGSLERSGLITKIFKRFVELLTFIAFLTIVFAWKGVSVDHRVVEVAHWEAPAGVALIAIEWVTHVVRHRTLRHVNAWYLEVAQYALACVVEIHARLSRARRAPS